MITPEMLETRETLEGIASGLDTVLNGNKHGKDRPYAFVLLIAPFHEEGDALPEKSRVNYISNAEREDIQGLLREMVERWDDEGARHEVPPTSSGSTRKDVH